MTMYIESVLLVKCYSPPPVNESGVFVAKKAYNIGYKPNLSKLLANGLLVMISHTVPKNICCTVYGRGGGGGWGPGG